ncbi:hypothetical protein ACF0H5_018347 [Mactra antiquata]
MANDIEQHENNLASYMHTMDNRINNIVEGMKENEMAIQHIQSQLYESFNDLEQSFSTMNVLMAKHIHESRILEHKFNELLAGVYDLVEGKLSPRIIPVDVMKNTVSSIQHILHDKFSSHYLIIDNLSEIYKIVDFVFARQGAKLYISVKFPISPFQQPLDIYKVLSFPVPVNSSAQHATQLLDLPQVMAVTSDLQYYTPIDMEYLNRCKLSKLFICNNKKTLFPMSYDTCVSALFKGDKVTVKNKCNFRFLSDHISLNQFLCQVLQF